MLHPDCWVCDTCTKSCQVLSAGRADDSFKGCSITPCQPPLSPPDFPAVPSATSLIVWSLCCSPMIGCAFVSAWIPLFSVPPITHYSLVLLSCPPHSVSAAFMVHKIRLLWVFSSLTRLWCFISESMHSTQHLAYHSDQSALSEFVNEWMKEQMNVWATMINSINGQNEMYS